MTIKKTINMKYSKTLFWEVKENSIEESKKYSSRTEFKSKSFGAYTVSKINGWLEEMTWLNRKNVFKDKVDTVYKYHFKEENAIYVGRTIYLELRDRQHRTRESDSVYRFAKERGVEIPMIEVLEEGLTVEQGIEREIYWEKYFRSNGFTMINKQPCGSIGFMAKGKWSKRKCFEEAKKYKCRSEFQKNASQAYKICMENGWINEMDWFPINRTHPNGYWKNKENIIAEAKKYDTRSDFMKGSKTAYKEAIKSGIINDFDWMETKDKLPFGYWKDKNHCIEEAKKYTSKKEFQVKNQSAYYASRIYGYLSDMPWLIKHKVSKDNVLRDKEYVMNEARKYKTRGEFQNKDKRTYSSALYYGWLDEMTWMPKDCKRPRGYWDDKNNVLNEVKKFSSKNEIKEKSPYLYKIINKVDYKDEFIFSEKE